MTIIEAAQRAQDRVLPPAFRRNRPAPARSVTPFTDRAGWRRDIAEHLTVLDAHAQLRRDYKSRTKWDQEKETCHEVIEPDPDRLYVAQVCIPTIIRDLIARIDALEAERAAR